MITEVALKPVPTVNGDGNNLAVCDKCHGCGTHHLATRYTKTESGQLKDETQNLHPSQLKSLKKLQKEGWMVVSSKCAECKGAVTILSSKPTVW